MSNYTTICILLNPECFFAMLLMANMNFREGERERGREGETERDREGETERDRGGETERDREKEKGRNRERQRCLEIRLCQCCMDAIHFRTSEW